LPPCLPQWPDPRANASTCATVPDEALAVGWPRQRSAVGSFVRTRGSGFQPLARDRSDLTGTARIPVSRRPKSTSPPNHCPLPAADATAQLGPGAQTPLAPQPGQQGGVVTAQTPVAFPRATYESWLGAARSTDAYVLLK